MNTNDGLRALIGDDIEKALEESRMEGKTFGKYRIVSEIGKGGMGAVYEAKDMSLGRTVVVKVVSFPSRDPDHCRMMINRFQREAQAACRVMHPNVAVTFAFDQVDGRHLLVMERIEGRTLRDEIMPEGKPRALAPRKAVKIVIEILQGLEAIHAAKIVHRDMKPGNVMLTHKDDQVKILDFGLGKASEPFGDAALDMTLTQAGTPLGSPLYMSPEQTRSLPVDGGTDIYSVGVILFQLLTGKAPFRGRDAVEIYELHRKAPVPPIVSPHGPVPPALDAVVRKAMAKMPVDRYGSASAMRAALEAVDFDPRPKTAQVKQASKARLILPIMAFVAIASLAVAFVAKTGMETPRRGPEAAIKADRGSSGAPVKAAVAVKASDGFEIPPPPPPAAATIAQGCELYTRGQTTDAITALTSALASKPDDAKGLYCLCGAYVRDRILAPDERGVCEAYVRHPSRDGNEAKQVRLWLKLPSR
ncbi:MAG TPA: serine/threonine-protein kinase [Candidatus Baltobacteraceae bacterium]|nr:serine/threonine-protein kinase [Candidatus Baltobacteraceae bacterium]